MNCRSMLGATTATAAAALLSAAWAPPAHAQEPAPPAVGRGIYLVREFRNPTFAAVASTVFPGGGQIYNDDLARFLVAAAGLGGSAALFLGSQDTTVRAVTGATFGLVWLWSIGDAYLAASVYNRDLEQQALR